METSLHQYRERLVLHSKYSAYIYMEHSYKCCAHVSRKRFDKLKNNTHKPSSRRMLYCPSWLSKRASTSSQRLYVIEASEILRIYAPVCTRPVRRHVVTICFWTFQGRRWWRVSQCNNILKQAHRTEPPRKPRHDCIKLKKTRHFHLNWGMRSYMPTLGDRLLECTKHPTYWTQMAFHAGQLTWYSGECCHTVEFCLGRWSTRWLDGWQDTWCYNFPYYSLNKLSVNWLVSRFICRKEKIPGRLWESLIQRQKVPLPQELLLSHQNMSPCESSSIAMEVVWKPAAGSHNNSSHKSDHARLNTGMTSLGMAIADEPQPRIHFDHVALWGAPSPYKTSQRNSMFTNVPAHDNSTGILDSAECRKKSTCLFTFIYISSLY